MAITRFQGKYRFLSNFYPATILLDGVEYPTVENAYQASKYLPRHRKDFTTMAPGQAKRMGRKSRELPVAWETIKTFQMKFLLRQKFEHPDLREQLLLTGTEEIIEGNTWGDMFWGMYNGVGSNHLGRLLMEIREEIKDDLNKKGLLT